MKKLLGGAIFAACYLGLAPNGAGAVSERLKNACRDDYRANCSAFDVGTEELRACMRANRHKLSKICVRELGRSDEVTEEDIKQYKRETGDRDDD
jgi:adenylate kinase